MIPASRFVLVDEVETFVAICYRDQGLAAATVTDELGTLLRTIVGREAASN
jgi:hypothetical protein